MKDNRKRIRRWYLVDDELEEVHIFRSRYALNVCRRFELNSRQVFKREAQRLINLGYTPMLSETTLDLIEAKKGVDY